MQKYFWKQMLMMIYDWDSDLINIDSIEINTIMYFIINRH